MESEAEKERDRKMREHEQANCRSSSPLLSFPDLSPFPFSLLLGLGWHRLSGHAGSGVMSFPYRASARKLCFPSKSAQQTLTWTLKSAELIWKKIPSKEIKKKAKNNFPAILDPLAVGCVLSIGWVGFEFARNGWVTKVDHVFGYI
jgi:hypothetical protein